jgi:phage tail sheath gpL-like
MTSDAIGQERVSRVVGYKLKKGNIATTSQNLPQRIAIFAEVNSDNQATFSLEPQEVTSAKQAGALFGYGSPIHQKMRILRPNSGDGVGGIPTIVFPQQEAPGASAKTITVTPVGVATASGTHYLIVNGRNGVDGVPYAINIESGDTVADVTQKIEDAINGVLGSPFAATSSDYLASATTKWKGLSANDSSITIEEGETDLGITYNIATTVAGAGTPSVQDALNRIGNEWFTIIDSGYGTVSSVMDAFEAFNGIPLDTAPTGRYSGIVFKPFHVITGSVADDPSSITDARKLNVTIVIAPAPLSKGLPLEAASNLTRLHAVTAQNTPELDVQGQYYPDMPTPDSIGSMADYNNRDLIVKKGCSTVDLVAGQYQIQDAVTTYHPDGETPPQFRYLRDMALDFNVRYAYKLKEDQYVLDHVIANDDDIVTVSKVVKPKTWKSVLSGLYDDLELRGLIVDSAFSVVSTVVEISGSNPNRLDTFFRYKRTGVVRQASTDAEAGFNFGTVNA